ncbi:MAG: DUF6677 family protein [Gemmataceae bacterium]
MDQPATPAPKSLSASPSNSLPSPHHVSPLGAVLSYLVPGLGQIVQGRVAKGLLFFVCIYFLFFYGMYLGAAEVRIDQRTYRLNSSVYLPVIASNNGPELKTGRFRNLPDCLYMRPQFLGQFWMGIVVWPALVQYWNMDPIVEAERLRQLEDRYEEWERLAENPEERRRVEQEIATLEQQTKHPYFGDWMREPSQRTINAVHNGTDKRVELAWVYTVIAGVLNIMVILDAFAGPVHRPDEPHQPEPAKE